MLGYAWDDFAERYLTGFSIKGGKHEYNLTPLNLLSVRPFVRLSVRPFVRLSVRQNHLWARRALALRRSYKEAPHRGAELSSDL